MNLQRKIEAFINSPYPIWQVDVASSLVERKLAQLTKFDPNQFDATSTFYSYITDTIKGRKLFIHDKCGIQLELMAGSMDEFYQEAGLVSCIEDGVANEDNASKLAHSFNVLMKVPDCFKTVEKLVRCIQVVRSGDPDIDVSYSHPQIPYTIFISVCNGCNSIENIRVAESILHESLHLMLTLIEETIPLVNFSYDEKFFSPWRDELRPAQGVLHGMFVFTGIFQFYKLLKSQPIIQDDAEFLTWRMEQIMSEVGALQVFTDSKALTRSGSILAKQLIKALTVD